MPTAEKLKVLIDVDAKGAVDGVRQVSSTTQQELGKAEQSAKDWGDSFVKAGAVMMAGAGVGIAGMVNVAGAASDLEESTNKVKVVFGESADEMLEFGKKSAEAAGLSTSAALDAAGGFGAMLTAMGFSNQEAQIMSEKLVVLAGDMASFNNQDPEEMLIKLRAGLAGEAEPLRQFGVQLNAAKIEAKALELGLIEAGEKMTDQAKAAGAYNVILEETAVQQGDFARTSEGLANATRILKADFENAKAELGQAFVPIMQKAVSTAGGLISAYSDLSDESKGVIDQTIILSTAGLATGGSILLLVGKIKQLVTAFKAMSIAGQTATQLGLIGAAAFGLIQTMKFLNSIFNNTKSGAEQLAEALEIQHLIDNLTGSFQAMGDEVEKTVEPFRQISEEIEDVFRDPNHLKAMEAGVENGAKTMEDALKKLNDELDNLFEDIEDPVELMASLQAIKELMSRTGIEAEILGEKTDLTSEATRILDQKIVDLTESYQDNQQQMDSARQTLEGTEGATDDVSEAAEELSGKAEKVKIKVSQWRMETERLNTKLQVQVDNALAAAGATLDYESAVDRAEDSVRAISEALDEEEVNLEDVDDATRDAKQAILDLGPAAVATWEAVSGKTLEAQDKAMLMREEYRKFAATLAPGSELRQFVNGLAADLDAAARPRVAEFQLVTKGQLPAAAAGRPIIRKSGGPVEGPRDAPVPATLHGGEFVLSADVVDAIKSGKKTLGLGLGGSSTSTGSGGTIFNINHLSLSGVNDPDKLVDELVRWSSRKGPIPIRVASNVR